MTTIDRLTRVAARVGVSVFATMAGDRVVLAEGGTGKSWRGTHLMAKYRNVTLDDACRQIAHRAGVGSVTCREEEDLDALLDLALKMQEGGGDE
jgi:hypothetical protein